MSETARQTPRQMTALLSEGLGDSLLEGLFDGMADAVVLADTTRHVVMANPAALALFGYQSEQLIGRSTATLYAAEETFAEQGRLRYHTGGAPAGGTFVTRYRTRDGHVFDGETHGGVISDPSAGRELFFAIVRDISDRLAIERATARLHEVASSQEMGFDARRHEMIRIGCALFELPIGVVSHVEGTRYEVVDVIHPNGSLSVGSVYQLNDTYCRRTLAADRPIAFHDVRDTPVRHESCYAHFGLESYIGAPVRVDSEVYGTLCFSSHEPRRAFPPEHIQFAGLIAQWLGHEIARERDLEELRSARDRLRLVAGTDELTGLFNRRRLSEALAQERDRAARYDERFSVLLADLDHFKSINDCFGHAVGDQALRLFARTASGAMRNADMVGRWGGEEFLLLLPHTTNAGARRLAERIVEKLRATPLRVDDERVTLSVSIGTATFDGSESVDALVSRADTALYAAKSGGRDRVEEAS